MTLLEQPVRGPRIVPAGALRTAEDVLPDGKPGFRVTQRYADRDAFFGGLHGAIDLGNYNCGAELLAATAGTAINRRDSYGALIVEIRGDDGWTTGYGHLSSFGVTSGVRVKVGQVIGRLGSSGLGNICHVHFTRRGPSGQLVDPWPLLVQNRRARVNGAGVNIRTGPSLSHHIYATSRSDGIYRISDGARLGELGMGMGGGWAWRSGGTHGIAPYPSSWRRVYLGGGWRYIARPLVTLL